VRQILCSPKIYIQIPGLRIVVNVVSRSEKAGDGRKVTLPVALEHFFVRPRLSDRSDTISENMRQTGVGLLKSPSPV